MISSVSQVSGSLDHGHIAVVVAMMSEARPIIKALGLERKGRLHPCYPMEHFACEHRPHVHLVVNGTCPRFGVDNIASQPATLSAFLCIEKFKPAILLNAGTAGGFEKDGSSVGDVYLSHPIVFFHDRRIPIPGFREFGVGSYSCPDVRAMAASIGVKTGSVSTGNSLSSIPEDLKIMQSYEGRAKDMEAAALAWVAEQHGVPFVAIKAITDLVDGEKPVHQAFLENLHIASERLAEKTLEVIEYIDRLGVPSWSATIRHVPSST